MLLPLVLIMMNREAGSAQLGYLITVLGVPMLLGPIGEPILGG
ncbi:hypothetical protein [Mycobacterium leprae]|nr:hypothetical protein [Mycobacterium leprae]